MTSSWRCVGDRQIIAYAEYRRLRGPNPYPRSGIIPLPDEFDEGVSKVLMCYD
jgi:hypothetical protein